MDIFQASPQEERLNEQKVKTVSYISFQDVCRDYQSGDTVVHAADLL